MVDTFAELWDPCSRLYVPRGRVDETFFNLRLRNEHFPGRQPQGILNAVVDPRRWDDVSDRPLHVESIAIIIINCRFVKNESWPFLT